MWSQALLDAQDWLNTKVLFIAQFQAALFHTMNVIGGDCGGKDSLCKALISLQKSWNIVHKSQCLFTFYGAFWPRFHPLSL